MVLFQNSFLEEAGRWQIVWKISELSTNHKMTAAEGKKLSPYRPFFEDFPELDRGWKREVMAGEMKN